MDGPDDKAAARGRNMARHLTRDHPDTVLFLARHAAGLPNATAAQIDQMDDDGMLLAAVVDGTLTEARVPFDPDGVAPDLRARFAALLRATRAVHPGPLTSLESRHAPGGREGD